MTLPKMYAHALESAADFVVDHDVDPVSIYVRAVYDYSSCSFRTVRAYIQVSANDAARIASATGIWSSVQSARRSAAVGCWRPVSKRLRRGCFQPSRSARAVCDRLARRR